MIPVRSQKLLRQFRRPCLSMKAT